MIQTEEFIVIGRIDSAGKIGRIGMAARILPRLTAVCLPRPAHAASPSLQIHLAAAG
jgi:hypothetical protein